VTAFYLAGIALVSVGMGLLLDWLHLYYALPIETSMQQQHELLPYGLSLFSAIVLLVLSVPALRNRLLPFFAKG